MTRFSIRGRAASSRLGYCAAMALLAITVGANVSRAFEIKRAGKLKVGRDVPLMAFSTDPTFQQVLSDDFSAARRDPGSSSRSVSTVTVTVSQQPLKPGISLNDLAPGDPQVADLIKAAGANPPPVGDTGTQFDEAAFARQQQARNWMPSDTPMEQMIQQFGPSGGGDPEMGMMGMGMMGPPLPCASRSVVTPGCPPPVQETPNAQPSSPGYTGDTQEYMRQGAGGPLSHFFGHDSGDRGYDVVIVARAAVSGQNEEMTVVSVVHPGEDPHDAKKMMAEKIADSILH